MLQLIEKKFVAFRVNRDSSATIKIPPGVELPKDVDLPVLVYTVPHKVSNLIGRWHLVGHARAGASELE